MGFLVSVSILAGLVLAAASLGGIGVSWHGRRKRRSALAERDQARAAAATANRTIRVWAAALRDATLTLQGHAEQCTDNCATPQVRAALGAALRQLVTLADDLQDEVAGTAAPALCATPVPLEQALRDAIDAVTISLAPGQRRWRLAPGLADHTLCADRRALSQVLHRVLGNAARHSRPGDWIEIGLAAAPDGLTLIVEDEGSGLCAPDHLAPSGAPESRGLGLGLALARRLMEAHGGSLTMQSVARVGTRVMLRFPDHRVVGDRIATGRVTAPGGGPICIGPPTDSVAMANDTPVAATHSAAQLLDLESHR